MSLQCGGKCEPCQCGIDQGRGRDHRGSGAGRKPPAQPAPSTTPAHRRSVWAPRNPAPLITDRLLTAPTGAPWPRCASPAALRPTPCLTRSHHCRLHQIASPRPRNVCACTDNVPDNDHTSSTTPLLPQQRRSAGYFAYPSSSRGLPGFPEMPSRGSKSAWSSVPSEPGAAAGRSVGWGIAGKSGQ